MVGQDAEIQLHSLKLNVMCYDVVVKYTGEVVT